MFSRIASFKRITAVVAFLLAFHLFLPTSTAQVANVTIDIPAPYGGELGTFAAGLAVQSRTRTVESGFIPDGNVNFSVGLGNSRKYLGLFVTANIYGLSNEIGQENNFGSGSLDLQLNRNINNYLFVGGGVRNLTYWKSPPGFPRNNRSFYFVSSYILPFHRRYTEPFSLLFITAGAGNGVFRLDKDFDPYTSGNFNFFGSIALQVLRGTNVLLEWNGYELVSGISLYPFRNIPTLGGTFSVTDLTEDRPRFVLSLGYSIRL